MCCFDEDDSGVRCYLGILEVSCRVLWIYLTRS